MEDLASEDLALADLALVDLASTEVSSSTMVSSSMMLSSSMMVSSLTMVSSLIVNPLAVQETSEAVPASVDREVEAKTLAATSSAQLTAEITVDSGEHIESRMRARKSHPFRGLLFDWAGRLINISQIKCARLDLHLYFAKYPNIYPYSKSLSQI